MAKKLKRYSAEFKAEIHSTIFFNASSRKKAEWYVNKVLEEQNEISYSDAIDGEATTCNYELVHMGRDDG